MSGPNPMDGYRDITPWPYDWTKDVDARLQVHLELLEQFHPTTEWWTYYAHWHRSPYPHGSVYKWVTDIYSEDASWERGQLPRAVGDAYVSTLLALFEPETWRVIWWGREWVKGTGWSDYTGPQGDFVDHVHIEWDSREFFYGGEDVE